LGVAGWGGIRVAGWGGIRVAGFSLAYEKESPMLIHQKL